ncbi:hypothetical protein MSAR_29520 [Mycolicibacterium sarraceniae]|uniref:Acyltransferase 3 domain-containing protein n=1 Tax=Mycolicibacterium sarraceniae TaxID=1534348 RepID=A0A7I7SVE7_9MYCO|nr:hypothetical protein MSAR_29520 [Mycolicibacterium sarraceniae]
MTQADSVRPPQEVPNRGSERSPFRPDIEGLRAIAVVAVVLFHAQVPGLAGGFVGVDVFFVISGFLITGVLWREANSSGTVGLRRFYGARARRLLPASAAVGVVTMIASSVLLPAIQARPAIVDGIASALYVSDYWFTVQNTSYFNHGQAPSPFLHYWSLGVEEQFYLVWPALIIATAWLIRLVRRRTRTQATSLARPYLIVLALVAVMSLRTVTGGHLPGSRRGLLLAAHPRVAVGSRWTGGPHCIPLAPVACPHFGGRRLDWAGPGRAGLHLVER